MTERPSLDELPSECDWGHCDREAVDWRHSPGPAEDAWLPVCEKHREPIPSIPVILQNRRGPKPRRVECGPVGPKLLDRRIKARRTVDQLVEPYRTPTLFPAEGTAAHLFPELETCAHCRFSGEHSSNEQVLICRRYPPEWPETAPSWWCGEWQPL